MLTRSINVILETFWPEISFFHVSFLKAQNTCKTDHFQNERLMDSAEKILLYLSNKSLGFICLWVPHGVVEPGQTDPEPVEPVVRAVDGQDRRPGVRLGHPAVPFQDDDLGPYLVVDRLPFVQHLLDVVLQWNDDDSVVSFMVLNNENWEI